MKYSAQKSILMLMLVLGVIFMSCGDEESTTTPDFPESITLQSTGLSPEGIEFDRNTNTFLLGSITMGQVVRVDLEGNVSPFTNDNDLFSSIGIHIDYATNSLYVAGIDGRILDPNFTEQGFSALYVYDLSTGSKVRQVMLSTLLEGSDFTGRFFANDLTVDNEGNVYVGDWNAGVIYKVDANGNASIFYGRDNQISIEPNGMVFHPDGYLLVSDLDAGVQVGIENPRLRLIKISLDDPTSASVVTINGTYFGFDGMIFDAGNVFGITGGIVDGNVTLGSFLQELSSDDNWTTANVEGQTRLKAQSTTVATTQTGVKYVINQDFLTPTATNWTIERVDF